MNRAIIVSDDCTAADFIGKTARNAGFTIVRMRSGNEVRRIVKNIYAPELVIINTPLPDEFGDGLAETVSEYSQVILICDGDISGEIADRLFTSGTTVISRPLDRETLISAIDYSHFPEIKESSEVLVRIENIRTISRAKSLLMKYLKFTEPQAHRYIEKQAMNNRCTRREAAEKILNTYGK